MTLTDTRMSRNSLLRGRLARRTVLLAAGALAASVSARGQHATPQTPVPAPLAHHLVASQLVTRVDSFDVVARGVARGWQRLTVTRDAAGWTLQDVVRLGASVTQESRVRLGADLREVQLRQEGRMGPADMNIALDWARTTSGDRVHGTALTPSSASSGTLVIDTVVAAGTVDDNAVLSLLPALRWGAALDVTFPVFASGKGTVSTYRIRVLGADSTTVPAGHFETWRADMQGGGSIVTLHVTRAAPFRLVRASPIGAPFEMLRARRDPDASGRVP